MIILSVSIRIPAADEAAAKVLNDKIVNATKDIKDVSISSVTISTLTRPADLRTQ